ncbi:MAG: NAD(P)-dependent alcohol dehydrogenase, partial [Bdellovibrionales bacterium]|nr:NAD(P)-dependent alcohol dehydrogenase [Bdellovibrionales bacterium]
MTKTLAYAAHNAQSPLAPFTFDRRAPGDGDVQIEILYCGVCHSDLHQARNEWGNSIFPMVPGHEIVGRVTAVGKNVTKFKTGDLAGVGCMVDSCQTCASCKDSLEQFCEEGMTQTYNGYERDGVTIAQGGYSSAIVVREEFVLKVSDKLPLDAVAPLLCAGITTYSPLRHWEVGPGQKVGIVGLGGLGHMGVKFARALGAHVVVFTTSPNKKEDALRLGAHEVVISRNEAEMNAHTGSFDFILNSV